MTTLRNNVGNHSGPSTTPVGVSVSRSPAWDIASKVNERRES